MCDQHARVTDQPVNQTHLLVLYSLSPALEVTGSSSQQNVVGVPVQAEDSGTDGLFNVLAHPPNLKEKRRFIDENILLDSPKPKKYASKRSPLASD